MIVEKKNFISNYKKGKAQVLKKNLIADIETPFSTLLKISKLVQKLIFCIILSL